jgi:hypothetical protein
MLQATATTLAAAGIHERPEAAPADSGYWSIDNLTTIPDAPELFIPPARHGRQGKTAFRSFRLGMAGSRPWRPSLTTSCRTGCGRSSSPCCPLHPARRTVGGTGPSPTGTASPRSCTWPGPPPMAAATGPRARLRLAGDLLAPPDRVDQRRRVRPAPRRGSGSAG